MATATSYVGEWINYWGRLGVNFSRRVQSASRDARAGKYGVDRLVSDSLALWAEGYEAWCGALLGRRASAEPAVVLFQVPPGTKAKQTTVAVQVPGDAPPAATDLVRVSGAGAVIPKGNVVVTVNDTRDQVEIHLVDLGTLKPAEGLYIGVVYADERPIAMIHALVTPDASR